jgi:hypothetical protein
MAFLDSELNNYAGSKSLKIVDGHIYAGGFNYSHTFDDDSPADRKRRRSRRRDPIHYSYNAPPKPLPDPPASEITLLPAPEPEPELTRERDGPAWWHIQAPAYEPEEEDPRAVRAYQEWQARKPEGAPPAVFLRWLRERPQT